VLPPNPRAAALAEHIKLTTHHSRTYKPSLSHNHCTLQPNNTFASPATAATATHCHTAMTRNHLTGFWPFRLVPIDADTRQPLDPNIGRRTAVTYYDIKKDGKGKPAIVAHRSPAPSAHGGNGT